MDAKQVWTKRRRRAGFTAGELLVTLLIVGVLAGVLLPVIRNTFGGCGHTSRSALVQVTEISKAIEVFHSHYHRLPGVPATESETDYAVLVSESKKIMRVLGAYDEERNPRRELYFEIYEDRDCGAIPEDGDLFDSWCNQYLIRLDDDGDRRILFAGQEIKARSLVWSTGPNGVNDWGFGDDITSW